MIYKLTQTQKFVLQKSKTSSVVNFRTICYTLMCLTFVAVLTLSALNGFLFFGWLSISMAIIFSLASIHLIGEQQTKRS